MNMQLIGRRKEMQRLQNAWASQDAFMMVTGRKYIGKSTLLRAFTEDKQTLYFSASNVSDHLNRVAFEHAFADYCGVAPKDTGRAGSWRDLLKLFADRPGTERKILVIDNFNYLVEADPGILNTFKHSWDSDLKPNFIMVVLVVPNGRLLLNMNDKSKSFMAHLTHRIALKPVTFVELMKDYPHHDFNQLMMLYAIVGGVPRYWEYFRECVDAEEFIAAAKDFFMNPYGDLLDEPMKLIENEVQDPTEYHSVLYALASGQNDLASIAVFCSYKSGQVDDLLKNLISLHFVTRDTSVVEKKFAFNKPVSYHISDPMLSFWYTFVFPYYQEIAGGSDTKALDHLAAGFGDYIQYWFREAACEILTTASKQKVIPITCNELGVFFNRDTTVDILGLDHTRKCIFLADCSYDNKAYTKADYEAFVEKCENIKELKAYKQYDRIYGIFASHPFDSELMDYALTTKNVMLFNGITLYSLNS